MSVKEKAIAAKNKVTTFYKEHGKTFLVGLGLGVAGGMYFAIRELTERVDRHGEIINQHAEVGNFERSHPWFIEKTGDDSFHAQRIELDPAVVDPAEEA